MKGTGLVTTAFAVATIAAATVAIPPALAQGDKAGGQEGGDASKQLPVIVFPENGASIGPGGAEAKLVLISDGSGNGPAKYMIATDQRSPVGDSSMPDKPATSVVIPPVSSPQSPAPSTPVNGDTDQLPKPAPQNPNVPQPAAAQQTTGSGAQDSTNNKTQETGTGKDDTDDKTGMKGDDDQTGKAGGSSSINDVTKSGSKTGASPTGSSPTKSGATKSGSTPSKSDTSSSDKKKSGTANSALSNATGAFSKSLLSACLALSVVALLI